MHSAAIATDMRAAEGGGLWWCGARGSEVWREAPRPGGRACTCWIFLMDWMRSFCIRPDAAANSGRSRQPRDVGALRSTCLAPSTLSANTPTTPHASCAALEARLTRCWARQGSQAPEIVHDTQWQRRDTMRQRRDAAAARACQPLLPPHPPRLVNCNNTSTRDWSYLYLASPRHTPHAARKTLNGSTKALDETPSTMRVE